MTRIELEMQLTGVLAQLNDDEYRVILHLAERLLLGQQRHGELDLSNPVDWRRERDEEIQDLLIYSAFESLKRS